MAPKRLAPFKNEHALKFCVKICERDAATKAVVSVSCLFCIHFGREEKIGSKRNRTTNVKYFNRPFHIDMYRWHLVSQHPGCWEEYSELNGSKKAGFFDKMLPWFITTPSNRTLVVCKLLFSCLWTRVSSMLSLAR